MARPEDRDEEPALRRGAWSATLVSGGTVRFSQRRGPAALMFVGSVLLLGLEVAILAVFSDGPISVSWRGAALLLVTIVTAAWFVPAPCWRLVTGRPRLEASEAGVRYGRFRVAWADVGAVRVANVNSVEVAAKHAARPRFLFDNRLVSALMRRLVKARGSWLSAWMDVSAEELADWLEDERRARQGMRPRRDLR